MWKVRDIQAAWWHVSPKQVYLIVSCDEKGKTNILTVGWAMHVSKKPQLIAIAVAKKRYSYKLLHKGKEFVFAVPNASMKKEALFCGTVSGEKIDKIKELKIKTRVAKYIKPPLLLECVVNMECKVIKEIKLGDHVVFIGKILAAYVSKKHKKILFDVPPRKMEAFDFALRYHLKHLKEPEGKIEY